MFELGKYMGAEQKAVTAYILAGRQAGRQADRQTVRQSDWRKRKDTF
jgi:hypothetical protein